MMNTGMPIVIPDISSETFGLTFWHVVTADETQSSLPDDQPTIKLELKKDVGEIKSIRWEIRLEGWEAIQNPQLQTFSKYPKITVDTTVKKEKETNNYKTRIVCIPRDEKPLAIKIIGEKANLSEEQINMLNNWIKILKSCPIPDENGDLTQDAYEHTASATMLGKSYNLYTCHTHTTTESN